MKVKDLLTLKEFKNAKIVTGNIGLENPIFSAMILEAADIENWGNENQLILTSYYALIELSDVELDNFFKKMKIIKISALALKVNRLIDSSPNILIDLCKKYSIPLIEIDNDVSYEKILISIFEPIINSQSHLLKTYYSSSKIFSNMKNNDSSLENIMQIYYKMINLDCKLSIPDKNIYINFGNQHLENFEIIDEKILDLKLSTNIYKLYTLYDEINKKSIYKIEVNYSIYNLFKFSIEIFKQNSAVEESLIMITENLIEAVIQKIQIKNYIQKEKHELLNSIAVSILFNTRKSTKDLYNLLEEASLNKFPYYQTIGILKNNEISEKFMDTLKNYLKKYSKYILYYESSKYILILLNVESKQNSISKHDILKLKKLFDYEILIVVSSVKNNINIYKATNECLDMLKFNEEYSNFKIITPNDFGFFKILLEPTFDIKNDETFQSLYSLKNEKPELFETFLEFVINNQNYIETSKKLFLHPKTVRYRINKIQDILSFDIKNTIQYLNFANVILVMNLIIDKK